MYDVVALGEALIDFTPCGKNENGYNTFVQNPGGAPPNLVATLAKYGLKTAIISKVGADMFGEFIEKTLSELNVETGGMIFDKNYNTTLAFVALNEAGDRDFNFYRRNEADVKLNKDEINTSLVENCKIFHFGSISLTHEPSRAATLYALDKAIKAGALISYDPNYREPLWDNRNKAIEQMKSVLNKVDFLKISEEEAALITNKSNAEDCISALLEYGIKFIAYTMGSKGAIYANKNFSGFSPAYDVKSIDTTGAGDIFYGTFLHEYLKNKIDINDEIAIKSAFAKANKAAGLSTAKKGAIPSIPFYSEL